jgi:eukaryotic-like serine/threonine-protein kinase
MRRYAAFISYSHADERWARWLQQSLERYRVPRSLRRELATGGSLPARLYPVFRDRDELASSGDLNAAIQSALDDSDALIVVCSPSAAASHWVNAEIRHFQASGRAHRIFTLVVAGTTRPAAPDCAFPPALLSAGDGTPLPEPLAAEPAEHADGRRGALLKIAAGLLGVGVDRLRRRDAQRQARLWSAVAAGATTVAIVTIGLAITAQLARQEADLRRGQAEKLIGFMLGDLRRRLEPIGKLDVLDAVGDEAMAYFSTLGDQATDQERLSRAMALRQIGEVRRSQGLLDDASAAFEESLRYITRLQADSPRNDEFLFELGQSEFWVGQTAFERNDLSTAAAALGRYMEHSRALVERDPGNLDYQRELAYAFSNLGTLARERRLPDEALGHFESGAAIEQQLLIRSPEDTDLRLSLAESYSWAGSSLLDLGRFEDSEQAFRRALDLLGALHRNGGSPRHSEEYADVGALLAGVLVSRGQAAEAVTHFDESSAVYAALARHDPANVSWQRGRLRVARLLGELKLALGDRGVDPATLEAISDEFRRNAEADSSNAWLQQDLALAERVHALSLWQAGRTEAALVVGRRAYERMSAVAGESDRATMRQNAALVADTYGLLLAAAGDAGGATDVWSEALRTLTDEPADSPVLMERVMTARLVARLGRTDDALQIADSLRRSGFADPRLPLPPDGP